MTSRLESLASRYLKHVAYDGHLGEPELAEAETAYILWDWDGLALLAYEQYLQQGRGAFIGPTTLEDQSSVTVVFDYVPYQGGALSKAVDGDMAANLSTSIEHYHPELDFIVVWLRQGKRPRWEVFRSDKQPGLTSPRDLYAGVPSEPRVRPS